MLHAAERTANRRKREAATLPDAPGYLTKRYPRARVSVAHACDKVGRLRAEVTDHRRQPGRGRFRTNLELCPPGLAEVLQQGPFCAVHGRVRDSHQGGARIGNREDIRGYRGHASEPERQHV